MTGDPNWSYEKMLPYFKKMETNNVKLAPIDSNYHNFHGPMRIANPNYRTKLADAFVEAGTELGFSPVDYNGPSQTGFSYIQATVTNGERMSANRAFLHPAKGRPNLVVSMRSRVVKLLIDPTSKRTYGVEFIKHNPGTIRRRIKVLATREVILSAGALNSAQLLMLSGIGPADHLREKNIRVLKDAPVGKNFMEHVVYSGLTFLINQELGMNMVNLLKFGKNPTLST